MANSNSETNDDNSTAGDNGSPETTKNDLNVSTPPKAEDSKSPSNENDEKEGNKVLEKSDLKENDKEATTPTAEASAATEATKTVPQELSSEKNEELKQSPTAVAVSPDSHSDGDNNNDNKSSPSKSHEDTSEKKTLKKKCPPDSASSGLPQRPVKRARTAYFIFMESKRPEVQAKYPDEGITGQARRLGELWKSLTTEEKETFQQQAAEERERVAREMEEWVAAGGSLEAAGDSANANSAQKDPTSLVFPPTRIKKICRLDPEVKTMSKEALALITKCAELATAKLGKETVRVAQVQNRRKLLPEDVAQVCGTREQFLFLREDVKDLLRQQKQLQSEAAAVAGSASDKAKSKIPDTASAGSKPLTSYFSTN